MEEEAVFIRISSEVALIMDSETLTTGNTYLEVGYNCISNFKVSPSCKMDAIILGLLEQRALAVKGTFRFQRLQTGSTQAGFRCVYVGPHDAKRK